MAVTSHGKQWERWHSIWIVWTFLFLPWIAFFYIGIRARSGRWGLWGLFYLIPSIFSGAPANSWQSNIGSILLVVFAIGGIIHAFRIRKEYLMRLETLQRSRTEVDADLRRRIQTEHSMDAKEKISNRNTGQPTATTQSSSQRVHSQPSAQSWNKLASESPETSTIDLNSSSEQELATLPGVGLIIAKRAINIRDSRGGFRSIEDFGEALNLKPHMIERIRPLVFVSSSQRPQHPDSSGRIVDF